MKQITLALYEYGTVNNDKCPPSLGYIRTRSGLTGSDPRYFIVPDTTSPTRYRALSEYLGPYVPNAKTMYCPNAPKFQYLQRMWDAGNEWDHPTEGTLGFLDPFKGAYCFWWNYKGYLPEFGGRFYGASTITRRRGESPVMVTDYFGSNNYRSPLYVSDTEPLEDFHPSYGSCEPFKHATRTDPDFRAADYWRSTQPSSNMWTTRLQAGLIDGSVIDYTPAEAVAVQVLSDPENPLSNGLFGWYGDFSIPRQAVRSR